MGKSELTQLKTMLQLIQEHINELKLTTERSYAYQYKKMIRNKQELREQIEE